MAYFCWEQISPDALSPLISRQMVVGRNVMLVRWQFKAGSLVPEHRHPHEQITHMVRGRMRFTLGGESLVIGPGDVVLVPPGTPHSVEVLEDCECLDIFSPVRQDFLDRSDAYLRQ